MRYECKECKSKKKPIIVNYFPPVLVLCPDCGNKDFEQKFIIDDRARIPKIRQ